MDLSRPYTALCPTLDSAVVTVLAGTTRPLTGREVARIVGSSQSGAMHVLHRLVEHGLVDRQEAGNALLFALNRDHLAAPAVEIIAAMRTELIGRLRQAIDKWEVAPVHASLFGSAARGDGGTDSDIDLLVIRPQEVAEDDPRWRDQVDRLAGDVSRWTGNQAAVAEVSASSVQQLRRERPSIVSELRADATTLAGLDVSELLGGNG